MDALITTLANGQAAVLAAITPAMPARCPERWAPACLFYKTGPAKGASRLDNALAMQSHVERIIGHNIDAFE